MMPAPLPDSRPAAPAATRHGTVIATRESRLALWQAAHVRDLLTARFGLDVALLGMTTRGDEILDRTLSKVGGKGLFVKELETALEEGRADLAVHSLKDVPMDLPAGFELAAVLEREDPRDAWVSSRYASLEQLPPGARVGTSSLRRVVQLRALRPDLVIEPVRGNLDTRLQKLDDGQYDAIVLAAAGLMRLELSARIRALFEPEQMLPCAGQGALGIEMRADAALSDAARGEARTLRGQLASLTHAATAFRVHAERAVSRALGGSCSMPLAAFATFDAADGAATARAAWTEDGRVDTAGRRVDGRGGGNDDAAGDAALALAAGATGSGVLSLRVALGHPEQTDRPLLRAAASARVASVDDARALGEHAAALLRDAGAHAYLQAAADGRAGDGA